jgi:hypothetical protein
MTWSGEFRARRSTTVTDSTSGVTASHQDRPVEALWHEILGKEFISVPRLSRIHYGGKYFDYPLKAANALSGCAF